MRRTADALASKSPATGVEADSGVTSRRESGPAMIRLARGQSSSGLNRLGWILFAIEFVVFAGQLLTAVDPQDEGQFLTYPWLIAQGRVPYRDIWMSYPPATYLMLVPFSGHGSLALVAERALGFSARILYVLVINRILTGSWRRFSWIGTPLTFGLVFLGSDTKPYPWLVAMPLVAVGLHLLGRKPKTAALLLLLASTFRIEFGIAGVAAFAIYAALDTRGRRQYMSMLVLFTLGFAGFYVLLSLATDGYAFRDIFTDQLVTVERSRFISLSKLPFGPLGIPFLVALLFGTPVVLLASLIQRELQLVASNLAVLILTSHFFQSADASHLFTTSALAIPWTVVSLCQMGEPGRVGRFGGRVIAGCLAWIGITVGAWGYLLVLAYGVYLSPLSPVAPNPPTELSKRVVMGDRIIIAADPTEARDDLQVLGYLHAHAKPNQEIFIAPESFTSSYTRTDLYYLIGLPPASRYLEVQPGIEVKPDVQRELIANLRTCQWIVWVRGGRWYGPVGDVALNAFPVEVYEKDHFRTVLQNGTYALLARVH
jgi:hypothetical protein